jgi:hypothetical protein
MGVLQMNDFIMEIITNHCDNDKEQATLLYQSSYLLQYLDKKTQSVDKSSKARGSFANLYAIYVLVEDYIKKGYLNSTTKQYATYEGMMFTDALTRTRELRFGEKLQNHALNNRCNDEFKKFFNSETSEIPIQRDLDAKRYWVNENLLKVFVPNSGTKNIAPICIEIIDKYVKLKMEGFSSFFDDLNELKISVSTNPNIAINFISDTLRPSSDARIFEIVSYVIVKYHFINQTIKYTLNGVTKEEPLTVFKVGRTNANDGGIDYIMQPLGRIFQVTEVLDFKKYFLDIDKLIHYPITFVVKQDITPSDALEKIRVNAAKKYPDPTVLNQYLSCFEEIITIPTLKQMLSSNIENGYLTNMVDELITQCKVEYNID